MFKRIIPVVVGAFLFLAGGCSSSGSSTAAPKSKASNGPTSSVKASTKNSGHDGSKAGVDPCTLLTPADVQAAVGFPVAAGKADDTGSAKVCSYFGTGDHEVEGVVIQSQAPEVFTTAYDGRNDAAMQQTYTIKPIAGLGEKAYSQITKGMNGSSQSATTAFTKNGASIFVGLDVDGMTADRALQVELGLAQKAASRL